MRVIVPTYEEWVAQKRRQFGEKFSEAALDPRFIRFWRSGERIKVREYPDGPEVTGTVGVSMGWAPAWLLIRRRGAYGSSILLDRRTVFIGVQDGRKWRPVEGL